MTVTEAVYSVKLVESNDINFIDWVQASGTILAVIISLSAWWISRQSLHAPYRTF